MERALELAESGAGNVSPNPMVGAVIVHENKIIGEGYHKQYGKPHAEVNAIQSVFDHYDNAEELLKNATIYVTLEPCAHHGKTPPCADLIIAKQIPHVVIGSRDPFAQVDGKGIQKLQHAKIKITLNVIEEKCNFLNRRFFTRIKEQRPYFILKWAETRNGYFAPRDNKQAWISSSESNVLNHRWRSEEDAILIGKNTALIDNPALTVRHWTGKNPIKIVIDRNLELPHSLNIFQGEETCIVFNSIKTDIVGNIKYLWLEDFDNYLPQMIAYQLYLMDIQSVIIEGGMQILNLFIKAGMWDEARIFKSQNNWPNGLKAPNINMQSIRSYHSGKDTLEIGFKKATKV